MKLRITRHADRQLTEIRAYIAKDNPRAADEVVAKIRAAATRLTEHPEMGRSVPGGRSREWPVRTLPYVIVYRVDVQKAELLILAVFHGSRKR